MLHQWKLRLTSNKTEIMRHRQVLRKKTIRQNIKSTSSDEASKVTTDVILNSIDSLGKRVDDCMEEIHMQLRQHSTMLATTARSMQLNSEEMKECKTKVNSLEKQVELLKKEKEAMKDRSHELEIQEEMVPLYQEEKRSSQRKYKGRHRQTSMPNRTRPEERGV
ncbi:hypothetical protein ILYODFUR_008136 [Ilyodon furcidens]|uniref:Uncharacterized protein n=1 Tax=Ilyodon furcidens TaxID=33524 RepID=A0ABV0V3W2_9TELE